MEQQGEEWSYIRLTHHNKAARHSGYRTAEAGASYFPAQNSPDKFCVLNPFHSKGVQERAADARFALYTSAK